MSTTGVAIIVITGIIILSFLDGNSAASINRIDFERKKLKKHLKKVKKFIVNFLITHLMDLHYVEL